MGSFDLLSAAAVAAITLAFALLRRRPLLFGAAWVIVLVATFLLAGFSPVAYPMEKVVLAVGLVLCCFGLVMVRAMLQRSVSLEMLAALDCGGASRTGQDPLTLRVAELSRYRLSVDRGGACRLTLAGRVAAALVGPLMGMTGGRDG